jgi:Arc/MetJ-type ribon-helix-helix transcriptional regulator
MAKDTVRYPDELVEEIQGLVDDGVFESKSEFHRFAAEYVLNLLRPDRDPSTFSYRELKRELEIDERHRAELLDADGGRPFLEAVIVVRQHGLRGEYEAAEAYIEENYDATDRECILLEEVLGNYRGTPAPPRRRDRDAGRSNSSSNSS